MIREHPFSTRVKFFEKIIFLTPWYPHFGYVLNRWSQTVVAKLSVNLRLMTFLFYCQCCNHCVHMFSRIYWFQNKKNLRHMWSAEYLFPTDFLKGHFEILYLKLRLQKVFIHTENSLLYNKLLIILCTKSVVGGFQVAFENFQIHYCLLLHS